MFRRALTGSLLAVLAGPLLATTPSATADDGGPTAPARSVDRTYVALGDSFASGPQILPMQTSVPASCARSTKNFPSVVAAAHPGVTFVDATCSGAKLTDLWAAQGAAPPQLEAVTKKTRMVTFGTLGGNDVGLVGIAASCVLGDCSGVSGDANHQKVERTRASLVKGVRAVKRRAPGATIVMVGYGTYLPPGGCPARVPVTAEEADYLQGLIDHLSDVIGEVAAQEDVLFADQREIPGNLDHTACADFADQWIRGIDVGDGTDGALLHPSAAGMQVTASRVTKVVHGARIRARAAMKTVAFTATCKKTTSKKAASKKVKLRTRGGKKLVTRVVFKVGTHKVKKDAKAPYVAKKKARKLRKIKGRPRAVVTVKVDSLRLTKTFRTQRPRCLRR